MGFLDWILLFAVIIGLFFAVRYMIKNKGGCSCRSSCSGNCSKCSNKCKGWKTALYLLWCRAVFRILRHSYHIWISYKSFPEIIKSVKNIFTKVLLIFHKKGMENMLTLLFCLNILFCTCRFVDVCNFVCILYSLLTPPILYFSYLFNLQTDFY